MEEILKQFDDKFDAVIINDGVNEPYIQNIGRVEKYSIDSYLEEVKPFLLHAYTLGLQKALTVVEEKKTDDLCFDCPHDHYNQAISEITSSLKALLPESN